MSKSNAQVIIPIDEYNNLMSKKLIDNLIKKYNDIVSELEGLLKNHLETDLLYILTKEKIDVYKKVIWDLIISDNSKYI